MPTWTSKNGQDDMVWGNATKINSYTWEYIVDLSNHNCEAGVYNTHIYAKADGQSVFVNSCKFNVEGIDGSRAVISVSDKEKANGTYKITASGFQAPTRIQSVRLAIWSDRNGSDDLKWEYMTANGDGTYSYNMDIADHNYDTGLYYTRFYVKDSRGVEQCVNTKKWTVSKMTNTDVIKVELSSNQSVFTVKLLNTSKNISDISFAVWGDKNGQNDIVWYSASKINEKTWMVQVPISNHKESGLYHIHCYKTVNGKQSYVGNSTYTITAFYGTVKTITRADSNGYIRVTVSGVKSMAGNCEYDKPYGKWFVRCSRICCY